MTDNPFDPGYREPEVDAAPDMPEPRLRSGGEGAVKPGIIRLDAEAYHADPAPQPSLSSTLAKTLLAQSPLHAWTESRRLNPDWQPTEKKTFDIGRAAHREVLGAGDSYVTIPSDILASDGAASTKAAKAFIADARKNGLVPLKEAEVEQVQLMGALAGERLASMGIRFDPARSELAAVAQIDGVWCRAMFDNTPEDPRQPIYDFKTCENAAPDACERAIMNYGYDVQAEHYRQVWKAATGEDRPFRFVFQEKSAPHEICVVELSADTLSIAARKVACARQIWGECLRTGNWPGYQLGVHQIDLPAYYAERWLERESADAERMRADASKRHAA